MQPAKGAKSFAALASIASLAFCSREAGAMRL